MGLISGAIELLFLSFLIVVYLVIVFLVACLLLGD